ncbi:hypothetical protein ACPV5V_27345, partial [Vibrio campbellii]
WWSTFQNAGRNMRQAMVADLDDTSGKSPRRRRSRSNRPKKSKPKS